jgi:hypothetical protein
MLLQPDEGNDLALQIAATRSEPGLFDRCPGLSFISLTIELASEEVSSCSHSQRPATCLASSNRADGPPFSPQYAHQP